MAAPTLSRIEGMTIKGRVQDGVIVLEGGITLPEGTEVIVSCKVESTTPPATATRVEFPLVHSRHPDTLRFTGQRVAELLEESVSNLAISVAVFSADVRPLPH